MNKIIVLSEAVIKRKKVKAGKILTSSQNEKQIMCKAWNAKSDTLISYK